MWEHTKPDSQSRFYHIDAFRHMRGVIDNAADISAALASSRLDYVNSILYCSA